MSAHFLQDLSCLFAAPQDIIKTGLVFSALLPPEQVREAARRCRDAGYHLEDVAVSEVQEGTLALYHFNHFDRPGRISCMALSPENTFDSIADIFPGADWHERECFDFFGTNFVGHPNLLPLLLPPDSPTHPLKKQGQKKAPLDTFFPWFRTSHVACWPELTDQCLAGATLSVDLDQTHVGEGIVQLNNERVAERGFYTDRFEQGKQDNTLILNMGPQHPSTHGVLRVMLEIDGEYILRAEPVLGYIHRMHEKMAEGKTYAQFIPNMGRVDYLHALAWNWAFVGAVEKLGGMQPSPRAEYLRVITCELNRISSHLLWWGAYLLDLGAFTPILYAFDDREELLDILQEMTGSRLTYAFFTFGGVAADMSDALKERITRFIVRLRNRLTMYKALVTDNFILLGRVEDIGHISQDMIVRYGATGPVLRGSGMGFDVRRNEPYSVYPELDFQIPTSDRTDALGRYLVRMHEIEQSLSIVEQAIVQIPDGDIQAKMPKKSKVPVGEVYFAVEGARGKIGCYLQSDGGKSPYRVKLRAPSFSNLSLFSELSQGTLLADAVSILGSLDLVIPEIDR